MITIILFELIGNKYYLMLIEKQEVLQLEVKLSVNKKEEVKLAEIRRIVLLEEKL